jgi:hypothetical protein
MTTFYTTGNHVAGPSLGDVERVWFSTRVRGGMTSIAIMAIFLSVAFATSRLHILTGSVLEVGGSCLHEHV